MTYICLPLLCPNFKSDRDYFLLAEPESITQTPCLSNQASAAQPMLNLKPLPIGGIMHLRRTQQPYPLLCAYQESHLKFSLIHFR